jgi:phosphatidylglycerophosphate synthase
VSSRAEAAEVKASTRSEFPRPAAARSRRQLLHAQAANLLSASRFVLAGVWLTAFLSGDRRLEILGPIALAGAISDFTDGRVARRMHSANRFGQWLDSLADIVFVLTALACQAHAGAIPIYIPILIATSFTQYVVDSLMISRGSILIKSRLGHWGGVINFALVIALAFAPPPRSPGMLIRSASPLIAIFYLAAISERTLSYRLIGARGSFRRTRASQRTQHEITF